MSADPVIHLLPRMQAVAVSAKQPQVPFVGRPVFQTVMPNGRSASNPRFFAWVDMVNVENAVIGDPAMHASPPKLRNKCELAPPIAVSLVLFEAVLSPMCQAAFFAAKAMLTSLTATFAGRLPFPPRSKVAGSAAVFSRSVFQAVKVGFERLLAFAAGDCNSALFHFVNIQHKRAKVNFDIACRRIEQAQRQGDLFIEGATP